MIVYGTNDTLNMNYKLHKQNIAPMSMNRKILKLLIKLLLER